MLSTLFYYYYEELQETEAAMEQYYQSGSQVSRRFMLLWDITPDVPAHPQPRPYHHQGAAYSYGCRTQQDLQHRAGRTTGPILGISWR